jgi:transcriptional regulator with XRE-family HTH domain
MLTDVLNWKLRRVAAGLRQLDVARLTGISTSRLSGIERGEVEPSALDRQFIELVLPQLPDEGPRDQPQKALSVRQGG